MRVLKEGILAYPECPTRYFEFDRFAEQAGDFLLCDAFFDFRLLKTKLAGEKIVYLEFEEPNRFCVADSSFNHIEYEDHFHRIFTLCPFTADWLNRTGGSEKRTPIYFPFNAGFAPPVRRKEHDVIYTGHLLAPSVERMARAISKFDYRLVSGSAHPLVTDRSASYVTKLELIARSKVTIVHNVLFPGRKHVAHLRTVPGAAENKAFEQVFSSPALFEESEPAEILLPHLKSRLFEAAFCRSLILCRRDPWNIAERFFTPETEFLYYEDGHLDQRLNEILSDWGSYAKVIDSAYQRAMDSYTTDAFFRTYLKDLN